MATGAERNDDQKVSVASANQNRLVGIYGICLSYLAVHMRTERKAPLRASCFPLIFDLRRFFKARIDLVESEFRMALVRHRLPAFVCPHCARADF